MVELSTGYMGLTLRNPIIAGSSGLSDSEEKIRQLENAGAGAVVLKSIFEEQIMMEAGSMKSQSMPHTEEYDYIVQYTKSHRLNRYIQLIRHAKESSEIPIIASINCVSSDEWVTFARQIEEAGADALELNLFVMPGDPEQKGEDLENNYMEIIRKVQKQVSIPLAAKISFYFSGLANFVTNLSVHGVKAVVMFNRFARPDINPDNQTVIPADIFSTPEEILLPLHWVGMLSGRVKCDLAASTGIHDGRDVIKCLLAGAGAVQVASCLYRNGPGHIRVMLKQLEDWMQAQRYERIVDFQGKLGYGRVQNPVLYERSQFMKYYSDARI